MTDQRISKYRQAAIAMKAGDFDLPVPIEGEDEIPALRSALSDLSRSMKAGFHEIVPLATVTERIHAGMLLDEVFNQVCDSFRSVILYDRIGFSLSDNDDQTVKARLEAPVMFRNGTCLSQRKQPANHHGNR